MRRHENLYKKSHKQAQTPNSKKHTLLSAPALELNLVAVTTLLFLGSTAPTATSGVSTIATNLGGAVKIVARPYRIGNPPEVRAGVLLVLFPDEGLMGVVGVRSPETLNLNLFIPLVVVVLDDIMEEEVPVGANEIRRCGVEFVERPSADIVLVLVLDNCDPATEGGGGA
jgi:hypothetical protein